MSPTQCRMARAALGLSISDLAAASGIRAMTLSRFERGANCYASTVGKLRSALEDRGAAFVATGEASLNGGEGVRLLP
jgi:transcriptional regulator with XRE-family HTH domain